MSDLKNLYLQARKGKPSDISSYVEAVEVAFNNPNDYIPNLEYIISSDVGLKTLKPFIEKYGLPIAAYDNVVSIIEQCIDKYDNRNMDASLYKEAKEYLESYKANNKHAFDMYDYYNEDASDYITTYYGSTNGKQNRMLVSGMIKKYGESAIPDLLITANQMGANAVSVLENAIAKSDMAKSSMFCEWVDYALNGNAISSIKENALSSIVGACEANNYDVYRESVIMNEEPIYEYSDKEHDAIRDLIAFKEFVLTGMNPSDTESIMKEQSDIYELYHEYCDTFFEEDDQVGEKEKEEYVPVFGIAKAYTDSKKLNDGRDKSEADIDSIRFSKTLRKVTRGDQFSHALVAFDADLTDMYSFEDEGIVHDSINNGDAWLSTKSIYMCVMFLPKSDVKKMKAYCKKLDESGKTEYAMNNILSAYIGKPSKEDNRFVCSSFTGFILNMCNKKNIHRDYTRLRPEDVTILPRAFYVATFRDRNDFIKRKDEIKSKVDDIFKAHKDEIDEYNNQLPKIMLQDTMRKEGRIDKIFDYIISNWA